MSAAVAVTSWLLWKGAGWASGKGLAPVDLPLPAAGRAGRARPVLATAMVQAVSRLLATRQGPGNVLDLQRTLELRLGTAIGSRTADLEFQASLDQRGSAFGSPSAFAYTLSTAPLGEVAVGLGMHGALATVSGGAASGLVSLVTGAARVAAGRAPACVCGGFDVSGDTTDAIALFLLEPVRAEVRVPRLSGWTLSFDPAADGPDGPALERVAEALASPQTTVVAAHTPDGQRAEVTVAPFPRDGPSG